MEEKTLLIKKITFKHVFYFIYSKKNINSTKHVFFFKQKLFFRIQFPNTIFFFLKTQKIILKNCSQKLFSKTVLKNNNQTCPKIVFLLSLVELIEF